MKGLYRKFEVNRIDGRDAPGKDRVDAEYFVLDLTYDKYAMGALLVYAFSIAESRPVLAADLLEKCGYHWNKMPAYMIVESMYTDELSIKVSHLIKTYSYEPQGAPFMQGNMLFQALALPQEEIQKQVKAMLTLATNLRNQNA